VIEFLVIALQFWRFQSRESDEEIVVMGKLGWLTISCVALIFCGVGAITSYAQTLTALISFNMVDGAYPSAALVQGRDGNLYGTTSGGGIISCLPPQGCGTVFKLTPAGILTTLHKFCPKKNCTDGQAPSALVLGTDGNFYGIAGGGGAHAGGTIFKITPRGTLTTLYSFCAQANCSDGFVPRSLTLGTDGNFYGATNFGGAGVYCCGTVFKITPDGQLTTLHNFDGSDGSSPSSLIQGSDGNFYGTTYGAFAFEDCESAGCGTVFKMMPSGTLTTLHIFGYTDGSNPLGQLVESTNGNFSGTTVYGGTVIDVCSGGCGTIFKITSSGKLTTLQYLNWSNGAEPFGGLVWATDGNYYGTTEGGFGMGTVYEVGSGRGATTLYGFPDPDGGVFPYAGLLQATNGIFYGSTFGDGVTSNGTIFSENVGLGPFVAFVQPSGKVGQTAQILGQGLTGTTNVTFNGVAATKFSVISNTYITAVVPAGATTGAVVVATPEGNLTSNVSFRITR
jgi:uncharacterized repeat protein (TIGR03803 family)